METRDEQLAFFGQHMGDMVTAAETGGASAVIEFISGFEEEEQLVLYAFHSRPLSFNDWQGKNLDTIADVGNAGLDTFITLANEAATEDEKNAILARANPLAYNVAANLAGIWPEDAMPREARHHEIGLRAADLAIEWRTEFGLPALNLAGAWFIRGTHLLGLGALNDLVETWTRAYEYTKQAIIDSGGDPQISKFSTPDFVVNYGYMGVAMRLNNAPEGKEIHEEAVKLLAGMGDEKRANEAEMFAGQLKTTWERYGN